jgi:lactate dehydrogenase-like 2-hydroxyacid dehydrogenase
LCGAGNRGLDKSRLLSLYKRTRVGVLQATAPHRTLSLGMGVIAALPIVYRCVFSKRLLEIPPSVSHKIITESKDEVLETPSPYGTHGKIISDPGRGRYLGNKMNVAAKSDATAEILMLKPMSAVERALTPEFTVHHLPPKADSEAFFEGVGPRVRGLFTFSGGGVLVDRALLSMLPNVEIVANLGVGHDSVDLEAADERGVIVINAGAVNAVDVAEHAFGLLLDGARAISAGDRYVRAGLWASKGRMKLTHRLSGRRLGILGLGSIGRAIAKRAEAFDMPVSYHNRRPRNDVPYRYVSSVLELARDADVLVAAAPGGEATHHLINRDVLDALGPNGILVNVGRGSVVDEAALVDALKDGTLGGTALDVFENEPNVSEALLTMPNVVLQPHVAGDTHEGLAAAIDMVALNLRAHFAGEDVLTPVM